MLEESLMGSAEMVQVVSSIIEQEVWTPSAENRVMVEKRVIKIIS